MALVGLAARRFGGRRARVHARASRAPAAQPRSPALGETVYVPRLVALLVDAAAAAGAQIRAVAASGELGVVSKAGATPEADAQTEADRRAEELILGALGAAFPNLAVVSEEEAEGAGAARPDARAEGIELAGIFPRSAAAAAAASRACPWPPRLRRALPLGRVVVFVDPLDGTNEFASGEREAVTVLLGVAVDGRPVAGVVHQPFAPGTGNAGRTVWGGPGAGVHGIDLAPAPPVPPVRVGVNRLERDDHQGPVVESLRAEEAIRVSASGYHFLRLLEGGSHLYLLLREASKKWDSCPGEALLLAAGGALTDSVGRRYRYGPDAGTWLNLSGVVAYRDSDLGLAALTGIRATLAPRTGYPMDVADASVAPPLLPLAPPGGWAALTVDMGMCLIDPAEAVVDVYTRLALEHGVTPPPHNEIRQGFRRAFGATGATYEGDGREFWRTVVAEALQSPDEELFEALYTYYDRPEAWCVVPGAAASLRRLRAAGVRVAIVSNWDTRLRGLVSALGLLDSVDTVVVSAEVGADKPGARIFEAALRALGLPPDAAARCVHVGDSVRNDVEGSASAGWGASILWAPGGEPGTAYDFVELADAVLAGRSFD